MRIALAVAIALSVVACKKPEAPPAAAAGAVAAAPAASTVKGTLVERLDVVPYSYLKITTPTGEEWAAVPQTDLEKGAEVIIENATAMPNWESKPLNRKFERVWFGTLAGKGGAPAAAAAPAPGAMPPAGMPGGMPPGAPSPKEMAAQHAAAAAGPADVGSVKVSKATGPDARTVAEVFAQKAKLKEKKVVVRGKVVKANTGIMGKNWFHVRDGSGTQAGGDFDITVTSNDNADPGDVVILTGVVRVDKDFGAGYAYPVIIEDAKFEKSK